MTDSLEKILEDMRVQAHKWWGGSEREIVLEWTHRIEALIPSKAEREYLKAAEVVFKKETAYQDGEPRDDGVSFFRVAIANAVDAYRALLAERGK